MKKKAFKQVRDWFIRPVSEEVADIILKNTLDPEFYRFLLTARGAAIPNLYLVSERDKDELEPKFKKENLDYEIWTRLDKGPVERWTDPNSKLERVSQMSKLFLMKGADKVRLVR